jgi:hypothetical protein
MLVPVTQTGVVALIRVQSLVLAQARQLLRPAPASPPSSQIGFVPLHSLSARQATHMPPFEPASTGAQKGVPPSVLLQEPATFSHAMQAPASTSQIGFEVPTHALQENFPPAPPAPPIEPAKNPHRALGWSLIGAGIAGGAVAGYLFAINGDGTDCRADNGCIHHWDTVVPASIITGVAAAAAVGGILYLRHGNEERSGMALVIQPLGLSLRGRL